MQHLTSDTLARLVDEAPDSGEALHLECCAECRTELDALRAQTAALAALPDFAAPTYAWPAIQARLRQDAPLRGRFAHRPWPRTVAIAAGLVLFLLGGATGTLLTGKDTVAVSDAAPAAASAQQAAQEVRRTEQAYLAALARYSALTGTAETADPVTRLAALEGIVLTTGAALQEAPADPVINGYHLTALGQRDATLRQLAREADDPWF